jgi:hypothetical protein
MWWIVIDVGCLECESSTDIVGLFRTKEEADRAAAKLQRSMRKWDGGHHVFLAAQIPEVGVITEAYRAALAGKTPTKEGAS